MFERYTEKARRIVFFARYIHQRIRAITAVREKI